jgi:hypothetical protein
MGFKDLMGKKKGVQCERNSDGSQTCTRFAVDGDQKIATGSSLTFSVDPQTCKAVVSGDVSSILDEEMEDFNKIKSAMEAGCRRGIA